MLLWAPWIAQLRIADPQKLRIWNHWNHGASSKSYILILGHLFFWSDTHITTYVFWVLVSFMWKKLFKNWCWNQLEIFVSKAWRIRLRPTSLRTPTLPLKVTLETRLSTWLGVGHGFRILTWWHWWHSKRRDDEAKLVGHYAVSNIPSLSQLTLETSASTGYSYSFRSRAMVSCHPRNVNDVNDFSDFWSWTRLGLLPLVFPDLPYTYSEGIENVVPAGYNLSALPSRWRYPGYANLGSFLS